MTSPISRREFIRAAAASAALGPGAFSFAGKSSTPFTIARIAGAPRARGVAYGQQFREGVRAFLEKEVYGVFAGKPMTRAEMTRYAGECREELARYSPEVAAELDGMAEGAGITEEEAVLLSLHEELTHAKMRPQGHCTVFAIGAPRTSGGSAFVGQTWDWMESVAGLSSMLDWKRNEGPSVLAYGFPGLPCGAGINSAGIALCWTSASLDASASQPGVGIPSYALLTHLLYQSTLDEVIREARRAKLAGWFTFVMGDASGRLVNLEGAPGELAVEEHRGELVRAYYGSRQMTRTPEGAPVKYITRCQRAYDHLAAQKAPLDAALLRRLFTEESCGITLGRMTIDAMIFDLGERCAWLTRGPHYGVEWQRFGFAG